MLFVMLCLSLWLSKQHSLGLSSLGALSQLRDHTEWLPCASTWSRHVQGAENRLLRGRPDLQSEF